MKLEASLLTTLDEARIALTTLVGLAPPKVAADIGSHVLGVGQLEWVGITPPCCRQSVRRGSLQLWVGAAIPDDKHTGPHAPVGPRDDVLHYVLGQPRGENGDACKLNLRQLTMVCEEETAAIAARMGLPEDESLPPGVQGENLYVSGVRLADIPAGSTVVFLAPDGRFRQVRLFVTAQNNPCEVPGNAVRGTHGRYKEAARGIRGLTLVVEFAETRGTEVLPGDFAVFFASGV